MLYPFLTSQARYAAQVNRHSINILMDRMDETAFDVNNLYSLTTSLATGLSYHQLVLYIRLVLANLQDSPFYIRMVSIHTMDYIDAAMTGTLSPHILPMMDLKKMLSHIEETLPSTLHLPISSEDTLHLYWYLCMHVLIANKQFLLLIDIPIQDWSQQLSIYKIFPLDIPHGNFTACKTSILNISALHRMKPWLWKYHPDSSGFVKKQMDSFVTSLHHSNHSQTHHLALQLCMPRIELVSLPVIQYRLEKHQMSVCLYRLHPMFGC